MKGKFFFCFIWFLSSVALRAQGRLEVTVNGIRDVKGSVWVGLFTNEADFPKKAAEGKIVKVTGSSIHVVFENLKTGNYAVSIFHDANANGKLDKNSLGIPKEGFGFGNNAMGTFGPPSFEKAKAVVEKEGVAKQVIKMRYM